MRWNTIHLSSRTGMIPQPDTDSFFSGILHHIFHRTSIVHSLPSGINQYILPSHRMVEVYMLYLCFIITGSSTSIPPTPGSTSRQYPGIISYHWRRIQMRNHLCTENRIQFLTHDNSTPGCIPGEGGNRLYRIWNNRFFYLRKTYFISFVFSRVINMCSRIRTIQISLSNHHPAVIGIKKHRKSPATTMRSFGIDSNSVLWILLVTWFVTLIPVIRMNPCFTVGRYWKFC